MNIDDKRDKVLEFIECNYNDLLMQARTRMDRRFLEYSEKQSAHYELVSDVIISIIDKFDKDPDFIFGMYERKELKNYIGKAIYINAKSLSAPFLQKKIKVHNRIDLWTNSRLKVKQVPGYNEVLTEEEEEQIKYEDRIIDAILEFLNNDEKLKEYFGEYYKHYRTLLESYALDKNSSYRELSRKYKIPVSSIFVDVRKAKQGVIKYLQDEKII